MGLNRLSSLIRYAGMGLWSIFWISTALLLGTLSRDSSLPLRFARRYWAPGMLWLSGAELRVTGLPEAGWERPAIYVMNHQSSLDIPAAFAVLPVDLRFIAKHTLRKVPFLGWYMSWTGMVFVDRSNSTRAVGSLAAAAERSGAASRSSPTPRAALARRAHPPLQEGAVRAGAPGRRAHRAVRDPGFAPGDALGPQAPQTRGGPDRVRGADPHGRTVDGGA
jgi:1-acyl-sn-glycerol-3-phosphate acyltransferase